MKNLKKVLALVLAVSMLMGFAVVANAAEYTDQADINADYTDAVEVLSALGILAGFPDGSFQPKGTLTRAQAAKIVSIIHNATVAGKIQDIGALYANSGDWFVDSKDHWARAYINYCRVCRLADGMTATTYVPEGILTGTQFLKMMLNVLEFDSDKEGFLGTGWDIRVLERANEVGLTAGLAKGWKAADPITREEAVQIIWNALDSYVVEYGSKVKFGGIAEGPVFLGEALITGEHVSRAGMTLAAMMGVDVTDEFDAFERPIRVWTFNGTSKAMLYPVYGQYTEAVSECDILKAYGIPETSSKKITVQHYVDGADAGEIVDMYHEKATSPACKKTFHGCTGTLTQLFKLSTGEYRMTEIHTWLGEVTKINKATHGYAGGTSEITVWDKEYPCCGKEIPGTITYPGTLTKGDIVLASYSFKTDLAYYVTAPETKDGALKGASGLAWPETTTIDSTKYNNSCRFALGWENFKADTYGMGLNGMVFHWFFDRYGNVIGCAPLGAEAGKWYVIDKIWDATAHEDGVYKVKAVLVDLDANLINAEIDSFGLWLGNKDENGNEIPDWFKCYEFEPWVERIHDAYINNGRYYNELYKGTQNKNDSYNLVDGITDPTKPVAEFVAHVATGENARVAALEKSDGSLYNNGVVDARLTESTRFLVKGVDGTYKAYKGYKALPTLTAYCNDMIDTNGDGFVDIVYLSNAIYGSETILGYVKEGYKEYNWRNGYYLIEVYVNGEKVLLGVNKDVKDYIATNAPGLFEFRMLGDDEGVSAVMSAEVELAAEFTVDAVSKDNTSAAMTSTAESALKSGTYPLTYENYKFFDANGASTTYEAVEAGQTWHVYIFNGVWYWFLQ